MKIPIKKHTKVRRPVSRYITYIMLGTYNVPFDLEGNSPLTLVQDIKPVREVSVAGYAEKLISLFNERLEENKTTIILEQDEIIPGSKPKSLLERIKERLK